MKYFLKCDCTVTRKADIYTCSSCKEKFCAKHIYSRIDGNNVSITKYAPLLCHKCYGEKYDPVS